MHIVLIEDNFALARAIAQRLRAIGHAVDLLQDGRKAQHFILHESADLLILDINLPSINGLVLLKSIRQQGNSVPVLMLTARGEIDDCVAGLDAGADDYMTKPFSMAEFEARVRALSRRKNLDFVSCETIGQLTFHRQQRYVSIAGKQLTIPRREIAILECLLERKERLISKSQLFNYVYGVGVDADVSIIEPHISRLRKRLTPYGVHIRTARGLGYMLEADAVDG